MEGDGRTGGKRSGEGDGRPERNLRARDASPAGSNASDGSSVEFLYAVRTEPDGRLVFNLGRRSSIERPLLVDLVSSDSSSSDSDSDSDNAEVIPTDGGEQGNVSARDARSRSAESEADVGNVTGESAEAEETSDDEGHGSDSDWLPSSVESEAEEEEDARNN
jgi:hypothetical protein